MLESLPADITLYEWPEADKLFVDGTGSRLLRDFDVIALYDMPGIMFRRGESPEFVSPPPYVIETWGALTRAGMPILALHHAIASWPTWEGFAEMLKGRFHYGPATLRGVDHPDSGYAMNVRQVFSVAQTAHPVCAGLPASFELTDETYQCPVFDREVTVLITTDAPRDDRHHASAFAAVRRESNPSWSHPPASPAVAWTHRCGNSQVVYLQPGEGPEAFENSHYRLIIGNALAWLATMNPDRVAKGAPAR